MAKKKQATYPSPADYPGPLPARDSVKAPVKERNQRGRFQGAGIEGTAARAVAHMQSTPPRSRTFGASERHAIDARDGDGKPATGAFRMETKRSGRTERLT